MKVVTPILSTGEAVMRGEFDQIAHKLSLRIQEQRQCVEGRSAAHRSTRTEKRKLLVLARALERVQALRSRLA